MKLDTLLSTIILVSFLVTIIMAVGSYVTYKLREARRPHADARLAESDAPYFTRVRAEEIENAKTDDVSFT